MYPFKVCHITTVHPVFDVRIFHKECVSLVEAGFETHLIGRYHRDVTVQGVHIIALPKLHAQGSGRIINDIWAFRKALHVRADVYHFHDPELLFIGLLLKFITGSKIIYDVHEDVKKHGMGKSWRKNIFRVFIAYGLRMVEKCIAPLIDTAVIAVPLLLPFCRKKVLVRNYPITSKLSLEKKGFLNTRKPRLIYIGLIRKKRGLFEMLSAVKILKESYPSVLLQLVGPFIPHELENECRRFLDKNHLKEHVGIMGRIPFEKGQQHIAHSDIGLCLLHPDPNYLNALPTKMFEYMLFKKPVVVSNFPLWESIVKKTKCGVVVDPLSPQVIADAIIGVYQNPKRMKEMGENGYRAVLNQYNWENEEKKLIACYRQLIA
ncbi:glycosyltransferase family 4 protein [bacterium]|nr:glycosyltransferase family 4 protein [bacterium]RQV92207.1 MAG: glycosyltransferase [bacterium]